jgi:hypothetical protein
VSVYLSDTIRSQSFSLSQRFEPAWASWLCFAPHPPLGFWPSELFPLSQPWHLSVLDALFPFQLAAVSLGQARARPSPPNSATSPRPPVSPDNTEMVLPHFPTMEIDISSKPAPPKWFGERASGRRPLAGRDESAETARPDLRKVG